MSKRYDREDAALERLEKENRELKQAVRSLLKQLKKLNKGYNKLHEEEKIQEKDIPKPSEKICYDCGGNYIKHELLGKTYRRCDNCGKRGRAKKI
jgi:predicted nuclease with TOPRIM domain